MKSPNQFSFNQQLIVSTGTSANPTIGAILLNVIPGAQRVIQALKQDDKAGVDWWVETSATDKRIAVDCKIREDDPQVKYNSDDLALETWSVVGKSVGWTLDEKKRCDYILWVFKETGRWVIVPFALLQKSFKARKDEWCSLYRVAQQETDKRYKSECVFVPRKEIWREIYRQSHGYSEDLKVIHAQQLGLFDDKAA